jgi:hypothetical protein
MLAQGLVGFVIPLWDVSSMSLRQTLTPESLLGTLVGRWLGSSVEPRLAFVSGGGRWNANGRWWKPPGQSGSNVEAADWGSSQPSVLVTLKALTAFAFESGSRARVDPGQPDQVHRLA